MTMRSRLRRMKGYGVRLLRWMRWELPVLPVLQIYGRFQSRHAFADHSARIQQPEAVALAQTAPFRGNEIPRILWIYWGQGEAAAPELVRRCIASWRLHNPGWEIRVLDATSAAELVDLSDIAAELPFRFKANALRLRLLERFGGVWADATCYCHRPLDDWMPLLGGLTGFFAFAAPGRDRWIDNWFIASAPGGRMIRLWRPAYDRYVTRLQRMPSVYFMMIYSFQWALLRNGALLQEFRARGSLPAVPSYALMTHMEGHFGPEAARELIAAGYPVSKFSWKSKTPEAELLSRLDAFLEGPALDVDQRASSKAI